MIQTVDVIKKIITPLNDLKIQYIVTGSVALLIFCHQITYKS